MPSIDINANVKVNGGGTPNKPGGGQSARVGGSVDLNVNYPDGRTEKKAVELTGRFQQSFAGMSRG